MDLRPRQSSALMLAWCQRRHAGQGKECCDLLIPKQNRPAGLLVCLGHSVYMRLATFDLRLATQLGAWRVAQWYGLESDSTVMRRLNIRICLLRPWDLIPRVMKPIFKPSLCQYQPPSSFPTPIPFASLSASPSPFKSTSSPSKNLSASR